MALGLGLAIQGSLEKQLEAQVGAIARSARQGVQEATDGLKSDLRTLVRPVLGQRAANAIRGDVFPKRASVLTLTPAGTVWIRWRRGEEVLAALQTGATIRARGGDYLAVPTENVPKTPRGRGGGRRFTISEVEQRFGQIIWIPGPRPGQLLAAVRASRTKRGFRALRSNARASTRRRAELVVMFILVPQVQMPRRLNFEGPARRWQKAVPALVARNFLRESRRASGRG